MRTSPLLLLCTTFGCSVCPSDGDSPDSPPRCGGERRDSGADKGPEIGSVQVVQVVHCCSLLCVGFFRLSDVSACKAWTHRG